MNDNAALNLVKKTFENSFDRESFLIFAKNLFHFLDTDSFIYRGNLIPDAFESHIKTLERIGKYEDAEGHKIDVLAVQLDKQSSLERARTIQRNFIAWYLNGSRGGVAKDAALVAFYTKDSDDWRLSLVKMDYHLGESKAGKIKAITDLTPARRFSFLVGANENTHTAQKQLLPILQDDEFKPGLADLESAFNVEVVTKDFFEKYKKLFLDTKDALDNIVAKDERIKADFLEKNIDTADFAKKLLGQIVFLYFLQKKGWFGVARDSNWGTGPKDFLRRLFEKQITDYDNFFNSILEPLFYEALAIERPDDFYSRFDCKIPFLNGGLFDPLGNYDWVHTDIRLPDDLFSNDRKTKEGDIGDGILDIFDRYNFTVKEDEPLEREVAVDPEMLGKVFENLLEVKDRKSKGTYYTPREIVHYMCQESLINYLVNECEEKVNRKDIETLIQYGESAVEHDSRVEQEGKETETYSYKLPESIRKNAQLIDDKLKNIRVCDPAIGSGAFPVGMMNEIVRTRNTLTSYFDDKEDRSIYNFKRDAIQNSLYGVDIDPGAVEIAKLRLWLSLMVDEEDIKQIKPLPNLDYKIMQGNSLLEEFEGVKLFDDRLLNSNVPVNDDQIEKLEARKKEIQKSLMTYYQKNPLWMKSQKIARPTELYQLEGELKRVQLSIKDETSVRFQIKDINQNALFGEDHKARVIWEKLQSLQKEFFETTQKNKKDDFKKQIENLEWELIEATLKEEKKESSLKKLEQYKRANIKPFFLWKLNFSEVFQEKGGFDIVIANPPYGVDINEIDLKSIKKKMKDTVNSNSAAIFIDFGKNELLNKHGTLSYIVPKSLLYSEQWFDLVKALIGKVTVLVDVEKAFREVLLEQVMFVFGNSISVESYLARKFLNNEFIRSIRLNNDTVTRFKAWICDVTNNELVVANKILGNIQTELLDNISNTKRGVGLQKYLKPLRDIPVIGGKNIFQYGINGNKGYLSKSDLSSNISKVTFMSQPKIMSQNIVAHVQNPQPHLVITATYDESGKILTLDTVNNTIVDAGYDPKYILALMNSSLICWYAYRFIYCAAIRTMHFDSYYVGKIPVLKINKESQKSVAQNVDNIFALTKTEDYLNDQPKQFQVKEYEKQIDQMVYELYGLTDEEIKIVEARQDEK